MKNSICMLMKKATLIAAALIVIGVLFEILTQLISSSSLVSIIAAYLGFFAIFIGLIVIIITALAVMLPKINKKLDACQH